MKKIPVGIEDFKVVSKESYYVDKSDYIEEIIKLPTQSVILFTRPRRFGKSLFLSMIQTYFDNLISSEIYFDNLKISKSSLYKEEMNKYPVIRIVMKDLKGDTFDGFILKLRNIISEQYIKYKDILNITGLTEAEKRYIKEVMEKNSSIVDLSISLRRLTDFLKRFYKTNVVLLIDEYDTPIDQAFSKNYYKEAISFFRNFYGEALKGNENIRFAIITGVLQMAKTSLFSDLNNIITDNYYPNRFSDCFGFLKEEVQALLSYYEISTDLNKIEEWYGGYNFGKSLLFNPRSILCFAQNQVFIPYWVKTAENNILGNILENADIRTLNNFNELVSNNLLYTSFDTAIDFLSLDRDENILFSYLTCAGYLTIDKIVDFQYSSLKFPNLEAKNAFMIEIKNKFVSKPNLTSFLNLRNAFLNGDCALISKYMEEVLLSSFSYFDFSLEKNYQIFVLTLLSFIFEDYIVKSEEITGNGRCDIIVRNKKENSFGAIFEIKNYKMNRPDPKRLTAGVSYALKQIEAKNYIEELKKVNSNPIYIYGIAFANKKVAITYKKVN